MQKLTGPPLPHPPNPPHPPLSSCAVWQMRRASKITLPSHLVLQLRSLPYRMAGAACEQDQLRAGAQERGDGHQPRDGVQGAHRHQGGRRRG